MAIAKGQQSQESVSRTLYVGVAAVKVLAVNPNKAELEKLYDREYENEPTYLSEIDIDGKKYPSVRVTFITKTDPEKNNGIDAMFQHSFFLQKRYRKGTQSGKFQIIDKYGRTAWATKEDIDAKRVPIYKKADGTEFPANIDADYRPALVGEAQLTEFIKNLLNIPNVQAYVNGEWIDNPKVNKEDCLVRLDDIEKYFKGDFKELKEVITYQPDNLVKILVGIKTSDDNRTHQTTYDGMSYKSVVSDYSKMDEEITNRKAQGGLATTEFECGDLHEYTITPSSTPSMSEVAAATLDEDPWS